MPQYLYIKYLMNWHLFLIFRIDKLIAFVLLFGVVVFFFGMCYSIYLFFYFLIRIKAHTWSSLIGQINTNVWLLFLFIKQEASQVHKHEMTMSIRRPNSNFILSGWLIDWLTWHTILFVFWNLLFFSATHKWNFDKTSSNTQFETKINFQWISRRQKQ